MSILELHIDGLERKALNRNALWGMIYFKMDNYCFPDELWYDAVSSVLEMWSIILCDFLSSAQSQCVLPFMDGDYEVLLNKCDSKHISVVCRYGDEITVRCSVEAMYLVDLVQNAMLTVINHCSQFTRTKQFHSFVKQYKNFLKTRK